MDASEAAAHAQLVEQPYCTRWTPEVVRALWAVPVEAVAELVSEGQTQRASWPEFITDPIIVPVHPALPLMPTLDGVRVIFDGRAEKDYVIETCIDRLSTPTKKETEMSKFGVVVQADGGLKVTRPRSSEESALVLAKREPGVDYFVIDASNAADARARAGAQIVRSVLIEPTAEELAQASKTKDRPVLDVGTRRWFVVALSDHNDAVIVGKEEGYRTCEGATEIAEREGRGVPVQALDAYTARERIDVLGEGVLPTEPYALNVGRTNLRVYGTEPINASKYYVTGPGTVHVDASCRFVRKTVADGLIKGKRYQEDLVAELKTAHENAGAPFKTKADGYIDVAPGVIALDYCRFCAVVAPTPAEVEHVRETSG